MKKTKFFAMVMMGCALFCSACSEDNNGEDEGDDSFFTEAEKSAAIATYVDKVVIPTYKNMLDNVTVFKEKVDAFLASGTQNDLNTACTAWREARKPWELSEAFLGGPATDKNLDPSLDTWPLDRDGINQVIKTGNFSGLEGDDESNQMLRGFHTAEYLLFFDGQPRILDTQQDDVDLNTSNVKKYLQQVTNDILRDTQMLYKAWYEGLPGDTEFPTAYGEALKKHEGTYGMTSAETVFAVILGEEGGMANIANEVGEKKIGDPVNEYANTSHEAGLLAVESWYSWNSIEDYSNNIKGIENCYLGGLENDRDEVNSLSALVKKVDPALDTEVQKKIKAAIAAIENIPHPFRNHLDVTKYPQVTVAQDACAEVVTILKTVRTKIGAN